MTIRALAAAALILAAGACAAPGVGPYQKELPPGRYTVEIRGMICTVCARAIVAEWSQIPEVEKAAIDFDKEVAVVTVRINQTVRVKDLRHALGNAASDANLGARYTLGQIQYIP